MEPTLFGLQLGYGNPHNRKSWDIKEASSFPCSWLTFVRFLLSTLKCFLALMWLKPIAQACWKQLKNQLSTNFGSSEQSYSFHCLSDQFRESSKWFKSHWNKLNTYPGTLLGILPQLPVFRSSQCKNRLPRRIWNNTGLQWGGNGYI